MSDHASFEDALANVQSEMIAVCLEYAGRTVSDVYVYCSTEGGTLQFDPFFVVDKVVVRRHKLANVDTSISRQRSLLDYGITQLKDLQAVATRFDRPLPTQLKLHYVVASGSLDASYEYTPQYTNDSSLTTGDVIDRWQEEVQAELKA